MMLPENFTSLAKNARKATLWDLIPAALIPGEEVSTSNLALRIGGIEHAKDVGRTLVEIGADGHCPHCTKGEIFKKYGRTMQRNVWKLAP